MKRVNIDFDEATHKVLSDYFEKRQLAFKVGCYLVLKHFSEDMKNEKLNI